jgi:hypothetical protein
MYLQQVLNYLELPWVMTMASVLQLAHMRNPCRGKLGAEAM